MRARDLHQRHANAAPAPRWHHARAARAEPPIALTQCARLRATAASRDRTELLSVKHPESWLRFERGEIDAAAFCEKFWAEEHAASQPPVSADGLLSHVRAHYRYLEGAERVLARLKATEGLGTHALSNYPVWYQAIEEELVLSKYLEWSFVSCHMGVRKPDGANEAGLRKRRRWSPRAARCARPLARARRADLPPAPPACSPCAPPPHARADVHYAPAAL